MKAKEEVIALFSNMQTWRRHIHQNPELSFEEFETANFIENKLSEFGIKSWRCAGTGVVALVGEGENCVALRADIDALPIIEETGLEYASLNEGVMHACGHDMHTTMLLAAAKILKNNEKELKGKVKLIFQLGEEKLPGGASMMIADGVLDNPKPQAIFGQHIYPAENTGVISTTSGPIMGSADEIYWTIEGNSTHAAQPHLGRDPIVTASAIIQYYQTLIAKFRDPLHSGVLSVSSIHGGTATNIVPDKVEMKGTLRSFNEKWRSDMHMWIEEGSTMIAKAYGCELKLNIVKGYPHVENNDDLAQFVENTAIREFGSQNYVKFEPKMWGEDFAFYGKHIPACFWFVGVKPIEIKSMPALHNSKINPDETAMINGASMLVNVAFDYLNKLSNVK